MQWHLVLILATTTAVILWNEYRKAQLFKEFKAQFKRVKVRKKNTTNHVNRSTGDSEYLLYLLQRKEKETQPILKTWWIFKILSVLRLNDELDNKLIEEAKELANTAPSCLTVYVAGMIAVKEVPGADWSDVIKEGFLNWGALTKFRLTNGATFADHNEFYPSAAPNLKAVCAAVHRYFSQIDESTFLERYSDRFSLLANPEDFAKIFKHHLRGQSQLAFALAVSQLDAALGDTLAIVTEGKMIIPKKLRLSLDTPELQAVIGEDCSFLFACLIGPLTSINLRNLVWHGFLSPGEFNPCYTSFLLLAMLSLDRPLEILRGKSDQRRRRTDTRQLGAFFDSVQPFTLERDSLFYEFASQLSESSYFVVPGHLPLWLEMWRLMAAGEIEAGLALLFPELEHSIRVVFTPFFPNPPQIYVASNDCADRLLSAAADELYTTLDVLLSYRFTPESEEVNNVFEELTEGELECLLDLLIWQNESPRVRDKLGHGMLILPVCEQILARLFAVTISLLLRHSFNPPQPQHPAVELALSQLADYRSVYHPKACLQKELANLAPRLVQTYETLKPHQQPEACEPLRAALQSRLDLLITALESQGYSSIVNGSTTICEARFTTYNTTKGSLKALSNLRQTIGSLLEFLGDMEIGFFALHGNILKRKANQKARKTYQYFMERIESLFLLAKIYIVTVELCLVTLNEKHSELSVILMTTGRSFGSQIRDHKAMKLMQFACCLLGIKIPNEPEQLSKTELRKNWLAVLQPICSLVGMESAESLVLTI